jgi:hypothetical protein
MNRIIIETIPHASQRYETVGDWQRDENGDLVIRVSGMGNPDYEALVALHELVEVLLCEKRGIKAEAVDAFDKEYEANRKEGDDSEPGDSLDAPYRKEHFFATNIEALMSAELGVDWPKYEAAINAL